MIERLVPHSTSGVIEKEHLEAALQQAINLEIATIPTYLYTYYSIKRAWSQSPTDLNRASKLNRDRLNSYQARVNADLAIVLKKGAPSMLKTAEGLRKYIQTHGKNVSVEQAAEMALTIQVYANKAAATTMSVVIEEMLHMALTSNVKQALFGPPDLRSGLPNFPVNLPGHEPPLPIDLGKFSQKQLKTLLKIESPKPYDDTPLQSRNVVEFTTIGQFYAMIEACVRKNYASLDSYSDERAQLIPTKGYYSQNSINTVYYDKKHQPQFMNADDSGGLVHVYSLSTALKAMEIVVEQGEGPPKGDGPSLDEFGEPVCEKLDTGVYDDKDKKEEDHFAKFLKLYCDIEGCEDAEDCNGYAAEFKAVDLDFHSFFVHNFPESPTIEGYQDKEVQATLRLINAIYTYTFLMVESCYYNKGNTQYEVFMFGIHKSMIWCISELCNSVSSWSSEYKEERKDGLYQGIFNVGAAFARHKFEDDGRSPKQQILDLAALAPSGTGPSGKDVSWVQKHLKNFPSVSLDHKVETLITS